MPPIALPTPQTPSSTPPRLSPPPCCARVRGTITPAAPNAMPSAATQTSSGGEAADPQRAEAAGRVAGACRRQCRMIGSRAIHTVPAKVATAAPTSAAPVMGDHDEGRDQHRAEHEDELEERGLGGHRGGAQVVPAGADPVTSVQARRIAAVSGG